MAQCKKVLTVEEVHNFYFRITRKNNATTLVLLGCSVFISPDDLTYVIFFKPLLITKCLYHI